MPLEHPPITVVIVDDEALIRSGFRRILTVAPDISVVGDSDGHDAIEVITRTRPDVVLLDIRMPVRSGLDILADIRRLALTPTVAILTTFDSDEHIAEALQIGAAGFLVKDTDPEQLPQLIRTLHGGGVVFSPTVSRSIIAGYLRPQRSFDAELVETLNSRERDVLTRLATGESNAEIGEHLFLSTATVKAHISTILTKLGVQGRVSAALIAERAGLLSEIS